MLIFLDEEKFHEAVNTVTDDNRIESTKRGDIGAAYEDLIENFDAREVEKVLGFFSPEVIDDETGETFPDTKFEERMKKIKKIPRERLLEICSRIFFAYGMAYALREDDD